MPSQPTTILPRIAKWPGADRAVGLYVQVFQGTPLLMQLFLAFFGVALLGVDVSAWTAASVALTLYTSAYLVEIWRGCVEAVPRGQWEAAQSLALSFGEQLRHVILPQAGRLASRPKRSPSMSPNCCTFELTLVFEMEPTLPKGESKKVFTCSINRRRVERRVVYFLTRRNHFNLANNLFAMENYNKLTGVKWLLAI